MNISRYGILTIFIIFTVKSKMLSFAIAGNAEVCFVIHARTTKSAFLKNSTIRLSAYALNAIRTLFHTRRHDANGINITDGRFNSV